MLKQLISTIIYFIQNKYSDFIMKQIKKKEKLKKAWQSSKSLDNKKSLNKIIKAINRLLSI